MNLGQLRALVARHAGHEDRLEVEFLLEHDPDCEPTRLSVVATLDSFIEDDEATPIGIKFIDTGYEQ